MHSVSLHGPQNSDDMMEVFLFETCESDVCGNCWGRVQLKISENFCARENYYSSQIPVVGMFNGGLVVMGTYLRT